MPPSKERKKQERDRTYLRSKVDVATDRKEDFHDYYHRDVKLSQQRQKKIPTIKTLKRTGKILL